MRHSKAPSPSRRPVARDFTAARGARLLRLRRDARGTTLIFVLGILALLALFAISFASMTRLERTASANYMDTVRADFAARAGLNAGVSSLRTSFRQPGGSSGTAGGFTSPSDPWWYTGHSSNTSAPGNGIPLQLAVNAATGKGRLSCPLQVLTTDPVYGASQTLTPLVTTNTQWISGTVGGTYVTKGDTYFLRILDCQGMLDANMNSTDLQNALPVFGAEVLSDLGALAGAMSSGDNVLSAALQPGYTVLNSQIPLSTRPYGSTSITPYVSPFSQASWITAFINYRNSLPNGQFRSKDQIHSAFQAVSVVAGNSAPGGEAPDRISQRGDDWYALYRDFMTCWAETDTNVVANQTSINLPVNSLGTTPAARRPINLNTAPRAVLATVLSNVTASILDPAQIIENEANSDQVTVLRDDGVNSRQPIRPYHLGSAPTITLTQGDADQIAQILVNYRTATGPFHSWHDVYMALNASAKTPGAGGGSGVANDKLAAALGALCPCYLPLGWNPDRSMFYWDDTLDPDGATAPLKVCVDKSGSKTIAEGCFNSGFFEIESMGRVYAGTSTLFVAGEASRRIVVQIGGTSWIRGQNDLSGPAAASLTDAIGAPEPANFAGNNKLGGWVQALPSTQGFLGSSWTGETSCKALENGGKVTADGFLQMRDYGFTSPASYTDTHANANTDWGTNFFTRDGVSNAATPDQGHVEMWMKEPQDNSVAGLEGTNESLFVCVRGEPPLDRHAEPGQFTGTDAGGTDMGAGSQTSSGVEGAVNGSVTDVGTGVRLEKYGNKFYVCRFFWGFPDGACPAIVNEPTVAGTIATSSDPTVPYKDMHRFLWSPQLQTLNWRPGTWHHVYVSWSDMTVTLYIDGTQIGSGSDDPTVGEGYAWQSPSVPGFYPPGNSGTGVDETDRIAADEQRIAADNAAITADNAQIAADKAAIATDAAAVTADQTAITADQTALAASPAPTDPSSITADITAKTTDMTAKQNDSDAKTTDIVNQNADITAKNADISAQNADIAAAKAAQGSGSVWAGDVAGLTFTAQAGLNRMALRTYYTPTGGVNNMRYDILGYHLTPYPNTTYTTLTSLGTTGAPFVLKNTMFDRWCNGTFDHVVVDQTSDNPPSPASTYRFGTNTSTVNLSTIQFPAGYVVEAVGFFGINAYNSSNVLTASMNSVSVNGIDKYGTGTRLSSPIVSTGTAALPFSINITPGANMNVTPWAIGGIWFSYEVPTVVLEGGVEADGT